MYSFKQRFLNTRPCLINADCCQCNAQPRLNPGHHCGARSGDDHCQLLGRADQILQSATGFRKKQGRRFEMIIDTLMLPYFFLVLIVHVLAYFLHTRPVRYLSWLHRAQTPYCSVCMHVNQNMLLQKRRLDGRLQHMDREIARLRQEAKDMFSPHQFAKSAKIERQANAIEKKKSSLGKSGPSVRVKYLVNLAKVLVPDTVVIIPRCVTSYSANFGSQQ